MVKNSKSILKKHTCKLLEAKRICWKNIAKMKWAQLGGEK
jgi:hypothetical protein